VKLDRNGKYPNFFGEQRLSLSIPGHRHGGNGRWPIVIGVLGVEISLISAVTPVLIYAGVPILQLVLILIALIAVFLVVHLIAYAIYRGLRWKIASGLPIFNPADRISLTPQERILIASNRQEPLDELNGYIKRGIRAVLIQGVKGVGKSTLAAFIARPEDFWIDFIGKKIDLPTLLMMSAEWLRFRELQATLKVAKSIGELHVLMLCNRLQVSPRRMFFDNLETLLKRRTTEFRDAGIALFFEKLILSNHNCQLVMTSRIIPVLCKGQNLNNVGQCALLKLGGLKDQDGAELLKSKGIRGTDEDRLREISAEVDGNPLLLKILPPLVNLPGGVRYLKDLKRWKEEFEERGLNTRLLNEAAQDGKLLLYRLSIIPEPVTFDELEVLCGSDPNAQQWVGGLVNRSLLEKISEGEFDTYRLHPAIAETARRELEKHPKLLRKARQRAVEMYLAASQQLKPSNEWRSLEDCQPLIRAAELMIDLGDFKNASNLVIETLQDPLDRWGYWRLLRDFYQDLLDLVSKFLWKPKEVKHAHGLIMRNYGTTVRQLGAIKQAIGFHERELSIMRRIGDRQGESRAYGNLGNAYESLGDCRKAIEFHEKHLKIAQEIGDLVGVGRAYGNLGNAYDSLGNYIKAVEFHEKHLKIAKEIGDRAGEGRANGNLGNAYDSLGDHRKAIEFHETDLRIAQEIGDLPCEGGAYGNLGNAWYALGEYDKAIEFYEKHMQIAQKTGDRAGEGRAYNNLGNAWQALGEYTKAAEFHKKDLRIAQELGDRAGEGITNHNLGEDYLLLGNFSEAAYFTVRGLLLFNELGMPYSRESIINLIKCKDKLDSEQFREAVVKSVGTDGAEKVDKLLLLHEDRQEKESVKSNKPGGPTATH
jgi:tetratricopeptide (TPR) repeat protein